MTHCTAQRLLSEVRSSFARSGRLSSEQVAVLLDLCTSPSHDVRESAISLLLNPPAGDDASHFLNLLRNMAVLPVKAGSLPFALIEALCEIPAFARSASDDPDIGRFFGRLLPRLPRNARRVLLQRRLPLMPFLDGFRPDLPGCLSVKCGGVIRRRWRILRRLLLGMKLDSPWAEITLADLLPLWRNGKSRRCCGFLRGRWLRVGRALVAPPADPQPGLQRLDIESLYWGGRGNLTLHLLTALFRSQAEELRAVRQAAFDAGNDTGRVVLSWHNASLAAAGGWAFEYMNTMIPSPSLYRKFRKAVLRRVDRLKESGIRDLANRLKKMRRDRLLIPKIIHALWESRTRSILEGTEESRWTEKIGAAAKYLENDLVTETLESGKLAWHGTVSPHQRVRLEDLTAWDMENENSWEDGLFLSAAIAIEAQRLLERGDISAFVLPWIDKFFISSRRDKDIFYLPALVRWFEEAGVDPLILFWEDTIHADSPSLQPGLARMREQGLACRGIGVFGRDGSKRKDAREVIRIEHRRTRLFALRPCSDVHHDRSFHNLVNNLDYSFLEQYDSSWKDNLCFLYSGTQVSSLLSVQCQMENIAPWLAAQGMKHPFGSLLRNRLRWEILGAKGSLSDPFSLGYASWGNLY